MQTLFFAKMGIRIFLVVASILFALYVVQAALPQSEYGPKIQGLMKNLHSTCIVQSGTDEPSINNVVNGIFIEEPQIKKYMKCLLVSAKVADEKGEFNAEVIAQLLPEKLREEGLKVIKNCISNINDIVVLEDKAFAFFKCYHNQNSDIFIFF